ncbi:DNA-formamidopyrimidine glycosylase family protein [Mucilaginibacter sp. L3T2-6]|uniref:DNA-formamidopyrimidine glycosylase family protein n=1 Tax=Mucilaginibacter sp. L3T2-6 TaxID=3062491 RepID=UPI00267633F1|nr:DNA-formamidopyrimidine glycosylase family protein [Mucilaginibacter sp. L3T2-6]MDO3644759.1 endonuclease [Mucilaginibacter sp. L3T2-6]MDV6217205.1 endonuclease [Mucilaginibacter sp. L3T2-6]
MPEGPSIIILKEAVKEFKGQTVIDATCNNGAIDAGRLINQPITDFKSWGKHFLICFPEFTIRVHMMMFGSYRVNSHRDKPARLHLQFENGELNFYAAQLLMINEPLDDLYDWETDVMSGLWDSYKAIEKMKAEPDLLACDALMNQQMFSGVGNIIKNEVLFNTHIHPLSKVNAIPPKKLKEMTNEARRYSFDFLKWKKAGVLKRHWLAYNKKECPRNHVPFMVKDTGKSQRKSFYCELCQTLYR